MSLAAVRAELNRQRQQAAEWHGWLAAAKAELKAAGGSMPWDCLRDALVTRYLKSEKATPAKSDTTWIGFCALASLPIVYLSKKDNLVSLPDDDVVAEPPAKKAKISEDADSLAKSISEFRAHAGELPFSASEDDIRAFFATCGDILKCELLHTHEGRSRGIAFITFATRAALDAAIVLNGSSFKGRAIKVSEATGHGKREKGKGKGKDKGKGKGKDDKNKDREGQRSFESREFEVFVGGLPYTASPETIQKDFGDCGPIGRCHIPLNAEGEHTGIAFINFLSREGMDKALEFNDQEYGGVYIRVQKAAAPRTIGRGKG